jgi:hypothetical protein
VRANLLWCSGEEAPIAILATAATDPPWCKHVPVEGLCGCLDVAFKRIWQTEQCWYDAIMIGLVLFPDELC